MSKPGLSHRSVTISTAHNSKTMVSSPNISSKPKIQHVPGQFDDAPDDDNEEEKSRSVLDEIYGRNGNGFDKQQRNSEGHLRMLSIIAASDSGKTVKSTVGNTHVNVTNNGKEAEEKSVPSFTSNHHASMKDLKKAKEDEIQSSSVKTTSTSGNDDFLRYAVANIYGAETDIAAAGSLLNSKKNSTSSFRMNKGSNKINGQNE